MQRPIGITAVRTALRGSRPMGMGALTTSSAGVTEMRSTHQALGCVPIPSSSFLERPFGALFLLLTFLKNKIYYTELFENLNRGGRMQTVALSVHGEALPGEMRLCDDCGRIATKFVGAEQFGCLAGQDLWLCDGCALREIARRVKYPPRGNCEGCKRSSVLLPLWIWYSDDYFAGLPDRFLCRDCKRQGARIKRGLQEAALAEEARRIEVLDVRRHRVRFLDWDGFPDDEYYWEIGFEYPRSVPRG